MEVGLLNPYVKLLYDVVENVVVVVADTKQHFVVVVTIVVVE